METLESPTVKLATKALLRLISEGEYPAGTRLPGERALSITLQVSRTTTRFALQDLEAQGILESHSKRGWYVRKQSKFSDRTSELESFTEVARARGLVSTSKVLSAKRRRATLQESEVFLIAPAAQVIEVVRLRKLDGVPICIDSSVMASGVCDKILEIDLKTASIYEGLQRLCGLNIHKSSYFLQAKQPTPEQITMLGLDEGEPILEVSATTRTEDGSIVLVSLTQYRGDSYRFQADLFRRSQSY